MKLIGDKKAVIGKALLVAWQALCFTAIMFVIGAFLVFATLMAWGGDGYYPAGIR